MSFGLCLDLLFLWHTACLLAAWRWAILFCYFLSWLSASLLVQRNEVEGPWVETFEVMDQNKSFQLKVLLWGIWLQQTNKIVSRPVPLSY